MFVSLSPFHSPAWGNRRSSMPYSKHLWRYAASYDSFSDHSKLLRMSDTMEPAQSILTKGSPQNTIIVWSFMILKATSRGTRKVSRSSLESGVRWGLLERDSTQSGTHIYITRIRHSNSISIKVMHYRTPSWWLDVPTRGRKNFLLESMQRQLSATLSQFWAYHRDSADYRRVYKGWPCLTAWSSGLCRELFQGEMWTVIRDVNQEHWGSNSIHGGGEYVVF